MNDQQATRKHSKKRSSRSDYTGPISTESSAGGEESRRLLQAQKKLLKERNYQLYLQMLEKQEEERLEKTVFHNCY